MYWNYMRKEMRKSFDDADEDVEPAFFNQIKAQKREGLLPKIKMLSKLFLNDGLRDAGKKDIIFLCHPRRIEKNGKMVSIYTDYIADRFENSVTLQRSGLGSYKPEKIHTRNVIFADKLSVGSYIYRYFVKYLQPKKYKAIRDRICSEMEGPFRDLKENYGFDPKQGLFADRATELYFFYRYKFPRYTALLKRISPKLIVEVVGGSFDARIINEAAVSLGIETLELQHGAGTLEICFPDNTTIDQLPKWYYTFGEFWKKASHLPIPDDRVLPMGFPYHDMEMEEYPPEKRKRDSNTIIFISGSKYGGEFSQLAVSLKKQCPELRVIYKLHPREYPYYKERYTGLEGSGVEIIADNKTPLYSLFSQCSMQVGVDSTAVYEGMSFKLFTYIWDIPKAVLTEDLTDMGYAKLFKDAEELARLIRSRQGELPDYDINDFFKEGSLDNIEQGILRIIKETGK